MDVREEEQEKNYFEQEKQNVFETWCCRTPRISYSGTVSSDEVFESIRNNLWQGIARRTFCDNYLRTMTIGKQFWKEWLTEEVLRRNQEKVLFDRVAVKSGLKGPYFKKRPVNRTSCNFKTMDVHQYTVWSWNKIKEIFYTE